MPLFARSYNDLVSDCIDDLASNTNLTRLSAGGKARAILESAARRMEEVYDTFDINLARAFVSSAPGQYLDLIGQLLGVDRESNAAATADEDMEVIKFYVATGTFGDINSGADIYIPRNANISSEADSHGVVYRLTSGVTLPATASQAWASAEATIPGSESNVGTSSLVYHDFESYTDIEDETLLVTNIHPIDSGKDFESDTNYRYRIVNRVLEAEAANETALRLAGLSVAGVSDIIIKKRYRGIGTFAIIIQSSAPTVSDSLIDNVRAKVEKVMAHGEKAYVMGPKESGISMTVVVHYKKKLDSDELDAIEADLDDTIDAYINGLDIGQEFSVNKLVSDLFSVSENISNLGQVGKPLDEIYIYKESRLGDNKVRQLLLGDYTPGELERVIVEPSVASPIIFQRKYVRN